MTGVWPSVGAVEVGVFEIRFEGRIDRIGAG